AAANALSVANTKADASAVSSLTTRVTAAEGTISSQGTSITGLNNSLTTTNTNVSAAQTAANAANTLAGGKGKVLVQTAAPAVADQLAQNLWIDITGGANTPKRWTGSAWVAVTDKVATDAAAAAQSALTQVATKADASAVTALDARVTTAEGNITAQAGQITTIQSTLGGLGLDPAPNSLWQFDASAEGWTATQATLSYAAGQITITSTSIDPNLLSPAVSINGGLYSKVKAKITRVAGSGWDGNFFYGTSGHGFTPSYYKLMPNPNLSIGQSVVLDLDMKVLTAGGNDWVNSTITQFRFDFGKTTTDVFSIDWVAVGRDGPSASSTALSELSTTVTQQGDTITAQATKLDGIFVQVNPALAGDDSGYAGSTASLVGVWSEQSARIEDGVALGQRIDAVTASVGEVSAAIQTETTARASVDAALSSQITTVQAVANSASAAVQTVSQAQASTDGRLGTMWAVKMQVNAQGQYVAAGIGLGIENGPAGLQSTFLVSADTFAVVNGINGTLSSPFAVTGGQVFIRSAFIQDLSLSFGKISDNIQSDNYVANSTGWKLSKAGGMELNSTVAGQGRVQVTNRAVKVWDANGVLRVQLGDLSA
uniref:DUF1983 domain-containing protein n=1 Tax=Pseudomonas sp. BF-RE-29 TaxID=2832378 RepID=UPI001CC08E2A